LPLVTKEKDPGFVLRGLMAILFLTDGCSEKNFGNHIF
jgi:hypothetical protein